jgi:hypothetical protein
MSTRAATPSLFGRFTAIQQQHSQLSRLSSELHAMCAALEAEPPLPLPVELSPRRLIAEWSRELSSHFETEEGLSYFGTLAAERPDLSFRIGDLRADHTAMLEAIEALSGLAGDERRHRELGLRTRELLRRFQVHEAAESALLQEFFKGVGDDFLAGRSGR